MKKKKKKHCPRPASRKKGSFQKSRQKSRLIPDKTFALVFTAQKTSGNVHEIFNDFAESTE
jgi:hypothetical protein